ncbi:MAG: hypothetical protein IOD09_11730 [Rhodocyclaceae bacterium]|nr:hypothetical protein [Rhodocyclaceae bacterium]MCA3128357.1 hypothetical protein [Rhodocyclaceae bacterium]
MPARAALSKGAASIGFVPGIGMWCDEAIVPTAPFSGEAIMGLLDEMARAPAGVAPALSKSEAVRRIIMRICSTPRPSASA